VNRKKGGDQEDHDQNEERDDGDGFERHGTNLPVGDGRIGASSAHFRDVEL
jgi:hypothetical protein